MNTDQMEYAGFWVRSGAALIDSLLIIIMTFPLLIMIYGWSYIDGTKTSFIEGPAEFLISYILPFVVTVLFWVTKEATPGKIALSLKVVNASTGHKISIGQAVLRYIGYFVAMIPLFLGIIWVGIDRKKQGLHDKLANTVVVRSKNAGVLPVKFNETN